MKVISIIAAILIMSSMTLSALKKKNRDVMRFSLIGLGSKKIQFNWIRQ